MGYLTVGVKLLGCQLINGLHFRDVPNMSRQDFNKSEEK